MKHCTKCGLEKPEDQFHKKGRTLRTWCIQCTREDNLKRYHSKDSTKEAHRRASRKSQLKKYGLTEEDFLRMYEEQCGACAICSKEIKPVSAVRAEACCVDHCHATGKVRGLLCFDCNVGLGKFFDNPDTLRKAATFLEERA